MSEFILDVKQRIVAQCQTLGISRETAAMLAAEVASEVAKDYAGERVYIGRADQEAAQRSARNSAIIRDWKAGERAPLLMRRYRISKTRLYEIIGG